MNVQEFIISPKTEAEETLKIGMEAIEATFGSFPVLSKSELSIRLKKADARLYIEGDADLEVGAVCDRCGEDVTLDIPVMIRRSIPIIDGELAMSDDEDATQAFLGSDLDTDRMVFDEVIEHWPMKILCRDDCKGLCPNCGRDLNKGDCGCDTFVPDPRMAGFIDILNSMEQ